MSNDENVELESQFILRLPPVQAASLRAAVKSGVLNLKDRLTIQLDDDMRHGFVRFDDWTMPTRLFDLPSIIESYKTLDKKNLYKTADISQIMICKEHEGETNHDSNVSEDKEESSQPQKPDYDALFASVGGVGKRDGKEKKFLFPHGITPPLKNVRKKRFRKTLKKKFVDYPEIENEVKRLFKADHEAIAVTYEVVGIEDNNKNNESKSNNNPQFPFEGTSGAHSGNALVDLFGDDDLSSSEDGDDEDSRLLSDDGNSRISLNMNAPKTSTHKNDDEDDDEDDMEDESYGNSKYGVGSTNAPTSFDNIIPQSTSTDDSDKISSNNAEMELENLSQEAAAEEAAASNLIAQNEGVEEKILELEREIKSLQTRRQAQELEIVGIDNAALRQRLQSFIDNLKELEQEKVKQYDALKLF